jgi:hypothetical protein
LRCVRCDHCPLHRSNHNFCVSCRLRLGGVSCDVSMVV